MRTTTEVFEDHLSRRLSGDVEGDIQANYSEDVVLLTGTGIYTGHEGVRQSAAELKRYVGAANFTYNHTLIKDEYAFLEWTVSDQDRVVCDGADGFYIKDGKIVMQNIHYTVDKK